MSESKIQIKFGIVEFSGEGDQDWLAKQLDKFLEKVSELLKIEIANPQKDLKNNQNSDEISEATKDGSTSNPSMTELEKSIFTRLAFTGGIWGVAAKSYLVGEIDDYTPKQIICDLANSVRFEHCRKNYEKDLLMDIERYVLLNAGELPDIVYRSVYRHKICNLDPREFTYPMS